MAGPRLWAARGHERERVRVRSRVRVRVHVRVRVFVCIRMRSYTAWPLSTICHVALRHARLLVAWSLRSMMRLSAVEFLPKPLTYAFTLPWCMKRQEPQPPSGLGKPRRA